MAELTVDLVTNLFKQEGYEVIPGCQTRHLPISGGDVGGSQGYGSFVFEKTKELMQLGLPQQSAEKLVRLYGSSIDSVIQYFHSFNEEIGLPVEIYASIQYAIDHEMVVRPIDYFIRRTGALLFDIQWVLEWKEKIISFMAEKLNWSEETKLNYTKELDIHLDSVKPNH
jgi:glycerol-3-phosphate dehydrogenase